MLKEFKEFAMKGNLVDIAVGFVMGAAFAKVISAFTEGIVSPLIGMIFQTEGLNDMKYVLKPGITERVDEAGTVIQAAVAENAVMYGSFIAALMDFIIVAFVMFMVIKGINKSKKKEEEAPAAPPANEVLLAEIRDLLQK